MPTLLLTTSRHALLTKEREDLEERLARLREARNTQDFRDTDEIFHGAHQRDFTADTNMNTIRGRLATVNGILQDYQIVEEPSGCAKLQIHTIGTFRQLDEPGRKKRIRIGCMEEVDSSTSTMPYIHLLPFIGQKRGIEAEIESGPMRGAWKLIRIELSAANESSDAA